MIGLPVSANHLKIQSAAQLKDVNEARRNTHQEVVDRLTRYFKARPSATHQIAVLKASRVNDALLVARDIAAHLEMGLVEMRVDAPDALSARLQEAQRNRMIFESAAVLRLSSQVVVDLGPDHMQWLERDGWPVVLVTEALPRSIESLLVSPPIVDLNHSTTHLQTAQWQTHFGERLDPASREMIPVWSASFNMSRSDFLNVRHHAANRQRWRTLSDNESFSAQDVQESLHILNSHQMPDLAERLAVQGSWADLIVPQETAGALERIVAFAKQRRVVLDDWRLRERVGYGTGLSVLFSGPPGTGKTLAAGLIAKRLGLEIYRVDLSQIVNKYVGETEKNLGALFDEAEKNQAVLLFDEADSLFGKRSQVKDAQDHYANLKVNYLLQRMEDYEGTCILTTNLEAAIDEAFRRRIRLTVRFPMPDERARCRLWSHLLPPHAPIEDGIDFDLLAEDFEFSGGLIKNAVLRASIHAAHLHQPLSTDLLLEAATQEAAAQGQLIRS